MVKWFQKNSKSIGYKSEEGAKFELVVVFIFWIQAHKRDLNVQPASSGHAFIQHVNIWLVCLKKYVKTALLRKKQNKTKNTPD